MYIMRASVVTSPDTEARCMPLIQLPVYSRFIFELTDPSGGPPQQASVVVSLADQWLRWPEATDPRYAAREIRPLIVALGSEGLVTVEE
jgi:hypothetical protein